jgi:hypothetical protein
VTEPHPEVPKPRPSPKPRATNYDPTFAAVLRPWVQRLHLGSNREVQLAAQQWLTDKGLN